MENSKAKGCCSSFSSRHPFNTPILSQNPHGGSMLTNAIVQVPHLAPEHCPVATFWTVGYSVFPPASSRWVHSRPWTSAAMRIRLRPGCDILFAERNTSVEPEYQLPCRGFASCRPQARKQLATPLAFFLSHRRARCLRDIVTCRLPCMQGGICVRRRADGGCACSQGREW